ncbi:hypothetical protein [Marinobacter sp. AC-23]|uniref:hypothetical protein n=1 Tax=Marinobacter sp. AC-23 TaxID=1879031 RepID=UPI0008DEA6F6|nr:hypothetical protein [Marinobacter sp. AC-23]OHY78746.1 hypothetical protein BCA33_17590 [Marinobacter sp. AC-23]
MEEHLKQKHVVRDWKGSKCNLTHCMKSEKSYDEAMSHVAPTNKKRTIETYLKLTYQRLVDGERLSGDSCPVREAGIQGTADAGPGNGDIHYYAFKKKPIRSYFWYSPYEKGLVYVSHYRFKNYQKLDGKDTEQVRNNFFSHEVKK